MAGKSSGAVSTGGTYIRGGQYYSYPVGASLPPGTYPAIAPPIKGTVFYGGGATPAATPIPPKVESPKPTISPEQLKSQADAKALQLRQEQESVRNRVILFNERWQNVVNRESLPQYYQEAQAVNQRIEKYNQFAQQATEQLNTIQTEYQKAQAAEQAPVLYEKQVGTMGGIPTVQVMYKGKEGERLATAEEIKQAGGMAGRLPQVLTIPKSQKDIAKIEQQISEAKTMSLRQKGIKGTIAGTSAGIATSALGTVKLGVALVSEPIQTIKGIPSGIASTAVKGYTMVKTGELASLLRTEPGFVIGYAGTEYATLKYAPEIARKGILKTSDIIRTRGLKEIPTKEIIAPEYYAGQTFPQIFKGETAGQLKKEFAPSLPGETKPAGFTAAGEPLKGLTIGRGASELPGLYQSPKLSPVFLRISESEKKLIAINIKETLRPTAFRVTPKTFELVPRLRETQKTLMPKKVVKEFFETAPKGKSYIPFIKSEKEAVLVYGTELGKPTKRFFFKFEGRRIPILEYPVVEPTALKTTKEITIEKLERKTISSRIGSKARYDPFSSLGGIRYSKSYAPSFKRMPLLSLKEPSSYSMKPIVKSRYGVPLSKLSKTYIEPSLSKIVSGIRKIPSPIKLPIRKSYAEPKMIKIPTIKPSGIITKEYRKFKPLKKEIGYDVFKIVKRKPKLVMKGIPLSSAKDIQVRELLKGLEATSFLRKSDIPARSIYTEREFERFGGLFREPTRKSPYRKLGEMVLVQRQTKVPGGRGRLTTPSEIKAIQRARMGRMLNTIK